MPFEAILASPLNTTGLKFVPSATRTEPEVFVPINKSSPLTVRSPPIVNIPVPVFIARFVVVFRPREPIPVISILDDELAKVIPCELNVKAPEPVVKECPSAIITSPSILIPPLPLFRLKAVVPVLFPRVTAFEFALVPKLIAPVVPESRLSAPVVPDVMFKADADAEVRVRVVPPARVVAPVPVRVAALDAIPNRVAPDVMKLRP